MANSNERIKQQTLEIYDSMPQDKELRKQCYAERDKIIELNYAFFGYVAKSTFINNPTVTYEDKLQSALMHFCECFWWNKWKGDETHKGYRQDISFTVFYKPRLGEMIERELNQVKYSVRRTLCMEVGAQIGKHWGKVRYEDLSDPRVHLSADKMNSLKAIFGSIYIADLEDHEAYLPAPSINTMIDEQLSDKYDSLEDLLVHEMIRCESKLSNSKIFEIATMYGLDPDILILHRKAAEDKLYQQLKANMDLIDD